MRYGIRLVAVAVLWLALTSCADDTGFTGSAGRGGARGGAAGRGGPRPSAVRNADAKPEPKADLDEGDTGGDTGNVDPFSALTWFWQCESAPVPLPPPLTDTEIVIEGVGPHRFLPAQLDGSPLVFQGKLCEPQQLPRDIVFVIDTSGSMNDNDPRVGDTCGRLTAIDAVLSSLPAGGTGRFGLVTFNTLLDRNSTMLFDSRDALFANLAGVGGIADVVCNAFGGTNYDAGLVKAEELLRTSGRAAATKEIYFISDGQPNPGLEGIPLASSLKTTGVTIGADSIPVTIATIMLAGADTVLEQFIASRGPDGKPLHAFVAQISQLTKALADLVSNEVVGAELAWRPIGAAQWNATNLLDHLQGFNFILPSFNINHSEAPQGLEVRYEYFDKHDNRYLSEGKLLWIAASGGEVSESSTGN